MAANHAHEERGGAAMVSPAIGARYRVGNGNTYQVTAIEGGRVTLQRRHLSAECIREQREFATDNRRDPDAEVAAFLASPMEVDMQWFSVRKDVMPISE